MSGLISTAELWAVLHYGADVDRSAYVSARLICARPGCERKLPIQRHQGNPRRWCSETCRVQTWRDTHPRQTTMKETT
jgi:hypothetical protein